MSWIPSRWDERLGPRIRGLIRIGGSALALGMVMTMHGRAAAVLQRPRVPVPLARSFREARKRPEIHKHAPDTTAPAQVEPTRALPAAIRLSLLGALAFSDRGEPVELSRTTQRLLAFLAMQGRPVSRAVVAEALWPGLGDELSHARLRTAIGSVEELVRGSVTINAGELSLSPEVDLDLGDARAVAYRILLVDTLPWEGSMMAAAIALLSADLLPEWYDDWAIISAEAWRQLRLRALEALAQQLLDAERYVEALEAVAEVRKADPLRESSYALTIRIHLAEGNHSGAAREFRSFRELLRKELDIEPSPQLWELMSGVMP